MKFPFLSRRAGAPSEDAELELYRGIIDTPDSFEEGFTIRSVVGALFCGIVMVPGSIYLSLLNGGNMNIAASWVTLILFAEVARRSLTILKKQEMIILLAVAGAMSGGGPMGELIYRQFLVSSSAMREAGLSDQFPGWYAPMPDSAAITDRSFFHRDWLLPIAITLAILVVHTVRSYISGYLFFRLTSDIEKLPFPMAPIAAAGSMALVEAGGRVVSPDGADRHSLLVGGEGPAAHGSAGVRHEPPVLVVHLALQCDSFSRLSVRPADVGPPGPRQHDHVVGHAR